MWCVNSALHDRRLTLAPVEVRHAGEAGSKLFPIQLSKPVGEHGNEAEDADTPVQAFIDRFGIHTHLRKIEKISRLEPR